MKESYLYQKTGDYIQCNTCNHHCRLAPFKKGICGVRENNRGKLVLLVYGRLIAENIDPIEKKPLFHFMPHTKTLSIATVGCNFRCDWCQNDDISQMPKTCDRDDIVNRVGIEIEPEQVVQHALKMNCPSVSYTYTEPTIFLEFALDVMKLAQKAGLKNIWVSNGYMTEDCLDLINPYLDAINVDLKGFKEENYLKFTGAKLKPILENIQSIYKRKIHLELTTLIIPEINDSDEELRDIANFIADISTDIPWHISRFFPAYKMMDRPITPIETLDRAEKIGQDAGLKNIYKGNI